MADQANNPMEQLKGNRDWLQTGLWLAFGLLFAFGSPVSAWARRDPLPPELLQAKTVYIQMDSFVPTKKNDDRGARASYLDPCKDVLQKWGQLTIVDDPKQADVILRISSQRGTTSAPVSTTSVSGWVNISQVTTTVAVYQASSGKELWVGAGEWVANWTAKIITKSIVNGLRLEVEKQEKALAKQAAQ